MARRKGVLWAWRKGGQEERLLPGQLQASSLARQLGCCLHKLLPFPSPSSEPGKQEEAQAADSVVEEDGIIALPAQLPQAPAPAPVTRHTDNTQQTHTPHMLQCLEQCEEQRPHSLSGIKLAGHRGSYDGGGTGAVRSSGVRGGGEVGCFLYS